MSFNIDIATLIFSIIAFLLGTIVPVVYRRFTHEGYSIQQLHDMNVLNVMFISDEHGEKGYGTFLYSTVLKMANVQKEAILISDAKVSPVKTKQLAFKQFSGWHGFDFKILAPGEVPALPSSIGKVGSWGEFPFILKTDEERIVTIDVRLIFRPNLGREKALDEFSEYLEKNGLRLYFRVNGKYRKFMLHIQAPKPDVGKS